MIKNQSIKTLLVLVLGVVVLSFLYTGCEKKPSPLLEPDLQALNAPSPDVYKVKFVTTKGDFVVEVHRDWSPNGADRLYWLAKNGFYDDVRFFRVIKGFMAQFGYHGDPKVIKTWSSLTIQDDPVVQSNLRGYVTYAKSGLPNSRTTQLFINYVDNPFLDQSGFSPIGKIVEGMDVVDNLYGGYGESAPQGSGPTQMEIRNSGNSYLAKNFPDLDYIKKTIVITDN